MPVESGACRLPKSSSDDGRQQICSFFRLHFYLLLLSPSLHYNSVPIITSQLRYLMSRPTGDIVAQSGLPIDRQITEHKKQIRKLVCLRSWSVTCWTAGLLDCQKLLDRQAWLLGSPCLFASWHAWPWWPAPTLWSIVDTFNGRLLFLLGLCPLSTSDVLPEHDLIASLTPDHM